MLSMILYLNKDLFQQQQKTKKAVSCNVHGKDVSTIKCELKSYT